MKPHAIAVIATFLASFVACFTYFATAPQPSVSNTSRAVDLTPPRRAKTQSQKMAKELKRKSPIQNLRTSKKNPPRTFKSEVAAAEVKFVSVYERYRRKALADKRRGILLTTETQIGRHLRSRGAQGLNVLDALAAVNAYMDVYGVR